VPLETIQDAVKKIKDRSIVDYRFDFESGVLEKKMMQKMKTAKFSLK
jgi:hypothetical protein